jgi:hypothetical protein
LFFVDACLLLLDGFQRAGVKQWQTYSFEHTRRQSLRTPQRGAHVQHGRADR